MSAQDQDLRLTYLDSLNALEAATEAVDDIVSDIRVLSGIADYDMVLLPDEDTPFKSSTYGRAQKILEKDWPTFEKFANALRAWRDARRHAEEIHARFPEGLPSGLEELPPLPSDRSSHRR